MDKLRGLPLYLVLGGVGVTILAIGLIAGGFNMALKLGISMEVRLVNNSNTWKQWQTIPIPVYLKVRVFNITNPEEIENLAKPKLYEMGPYVYREEIFKVDITGDEDTDSVRYRQIRHYFFEKEMSVGSETDLVTIINIPFVGVAKLAHEFTDEPFLLGTLEEMITTKGEKLTRRETIRDILFDGFNVQMYVDLANDPLVQNAGEVHLPEKILDGRMGILEGKNGSDEGWMVVKTGRSDNSEFGKILAFKDNDRFKVWPGEDCNMIKGTDGIIFPPFLSPNMRLHILVPDLCRSIYYDYTESVEYDGIPAYRFRQPLAMYQPPTKNPSNQCFCPINETCTTNGLLSVSPCFEGAPLVLSQPHFLFVDKETQDKIEGLSPDPEKHWGYMDLNPTTGVALGARHRFQFNMALTNYESMITFSNVTNAVIPVLWLEEGATLVGKNKLLLKALAIAMNGWKFGQWLLLLLGLVGLPGIGLFFAMKRSKENKVKLIKPSTPEK